MSKKKKKKKNFKIKRKIRMRKEDHERAFPLKDPKGTGIMHKVGYSYELTN